MRITDLKFVPQGTPGPCLLPMIPRVAFAVKMVIWSFVIFDLENTFSAHYNIKA